MAIGEIDADYTTGICFVGFINKAARIGLLLAPSTAALLIGGYIIIRGKNIYHNIPKIIIYVFRSSSFGESKGGKPRSYL